MPRMEAVLSKNIWMSGLPVLEFATEVMSPIQKQMETRKMKPVRAPTQTAVTIARGAFR